jgi:hypothetical protein
VAAHEQNIVYRDLKPNNAMLAQQRPRPAGHKRRRCPMLSVGHTRPLDPLERLIV